MKARRGVHVPWLLLLTGRVKSEISVLLALRVRADRWRRASEGLSRSILPLKRLRSMCLREVGLPFGPPRLLFIKRPSIANRAARCAFVPYNPRLKEIQNCVPALP